MGLAASQARFLGLTARKASCEFQSTHLAQQKMQISQQLSEASFEYANSMNATKLVWDNDSLDNIYGMTYSLLMMPSDANDYNPYLITSPSGAIVLNSKYAAAAKAAGISMGGGLGSQESRDKFIAAMAGEGLATKETAKKIAVKDYDYDVTTKTCSEKEAADDDNIGVVWNQVAGLGGMPIDKNSVNVMSLADLITLNRVGGRNIDWISVVAPEYGYSQSSYNSKLNAYDVAIAKVKNDYASINPIVTIPIGITDSEKFYSKGENYYYNDVATAYEASVKKDAAAYEDYKVAKELYEAHKDDQNGAVAYENKYYYAKQAWEATTSYQLFGQYLDITEASDYHATNNPDGKTIIEKNSAQALLDANKKDYALHWAIFEKMRYDADNKSKVVQWDTEGGPVFSNNFGTYAGDYGGKIGLIKNGSFLTAAGDIKDLTLGDLLSDDIAIMTYFESGGAAETISKWGERILDQVASIFGLGSLGVGLNVDEASSEALAYAYHMVKRHILKVGNLEASGNQYDGSNPRNNSAFINATKYNRIGLTEDYRHAALDLSNMVSAFLTYYDQKLRGADSVHDGYNVGRGIDATESSKTYFVTDNPYYSYILEGSPSITTEQKYADFYDELYNNICHYGWRLDDSVDHTDYLESAIKDGRYSMMALNNDGFYYQTRYNHTGYLKEVQDDDAITRAEVKYNQIKADLSVKEEYIDIKTKNMDAEIAELNAEIETVKQLISKGIEKTFQMYQQ